MKRQDNSSLEPKDDVSPKTKSGKEVYPKGETPYLGDFYMQFLSLTTQISDPKNINDKKKIEFFKKYIETLLKYLEKHPESVYARTIDLISCELHRITSAFDEEKIKELEKKVKEASKKLAGKKLNDNPWAEKINEAGGKKGHGGDPQPNIEGYPGKKLNVNPWADTSYPIDLKKAEEERDRILREASNNCVRRGLSPEGKGVETRITRRFLTPKISWYDVVFEMIYQSSTVYTTFLYPDVRFTNEPFIIPGTKERERTDIIVAVDVSGSIDDELYMEFMTKILGMLQQVSNVQILLIFFDTEIKEKKFIIRNTDDEYYLRSIKVPNTGGGALFQPIFDFMNELYDKGLVEFEDNDGRYINVVARNIVILTDGCNADSPREYNIGVNIPYRVVWIIKPSGCENPPIGEIYKL